MESLDQNMKIGIDVVKTVRQLVPQSNNYLYSSSPIQMANGRYLYQANNADIHYLRAELSEVSEEITAQKSNNGKLNKKLLEARATTIINAGCGNCNELSIVSNYILRTKYNTASELVAVHSRRAFNSQEKGTPNTSVLPHVFCVIGRHNSNDAMKSDIKLPSTWGPCAVVIDSWDRAVYPAAHYILHWQGLEKSANGRELYCALRLKT